MSYEFSLSKKKMIGVFLAFIALGILIFVCGWAAGLFVRMPKIPPQQAALEPVPAAPAQAPEKASPGPVRKPVPQKPETGVSETVERPETGVSETVGGQETPLPLPKTEGVEEKKTPEKPKGAPEGVAAGEQASGATPEKGPPDKMAETEQAAVEGKKDETEQVQAESKGDDRAFSVQVGSFVVETNARKLARELKGKGYETSLLYMRDSSDKVWYVVQIGDFRESRKAFEAASAFTEKEKMVGVVVPIPLPLLEERKKPTAGEQRPEGPSEKGPAEAKPEEKPSDKAKGASTQ